MKLSFSLSDDVAKQLEQQSLAVAGGNASILVDLALKRLLSLSRDELTKLVDRHRLDRKATTRDGWSHAFWTMLGEEMGREDRIDNPLAPRNYGAHYVVLLLNHIGRYDDENDPFHIHVGPQPATPDTAGHDKRFEFHRFDSPVEAAEAVAAWLRKGQKQK